MKTPITIEALENAGFRRVIKLHPLIVYWRGRIVICHRFGQWFLCVYWNGIKLQNRYVTYMEDLDFIA